MNAALKKLLSRITASAMVVLFGTNMVITPLSFAQMVPYLPEAGIMVNMTPKFDPMVVKGIKLYPDDPFKFDFIVDTGDMNLSRNQIKDQGQKLASYFLASLTTPEKEMWVNLSPYEKSRIIPPAFGDTEMGKELLSEDYMLKQIMATALYPERQLGKEFWQKVYAEAERQFGTTAVPVSTFNKVWIVPNEAVVYENAPLNSVFVVKSSLKVMLEQDYLAANKHKAMEQYGMTQDALQKTLQTNAIGTMGSRIIKEVVIPALEREVNEGKNFAGLRQVYQSLILAAWYKKNLRDNVLSQGYVDRNKTLGIDTQDKEIIAKIYRQYLRAYRKGVYNYIKEDIDPATQQVVPRKYFSGGFLGDMSRLRNISGIQARALGFDGAMLGSARRGTLLGIVVAGVALLATAAPALAGTHGVAPGVSAGGEHSIAAAMSLPGDAQTHKIEQFAVRSPLPNEIVLYNVTGNIELAAVNAINHGSSGQVNIKPGKSVISAIETAGAISIEEGGHAIQITPENANNAFQSYTLHIQVRGTELASGTVAAPTSTATHTASISPVPQSPLPAVQPPTTWHTTAPAAPSESAATPKITSTSATQPTVNANGELSWKDSWSTTLKAYTDSTAGPVVHNFSDRRVVVSMPSNNKRPIALSAPAVSSATPTVSVAPASAPAPVLPPVVQATTSVQQTAAPVVQVVGAGGNLQHPVFTNLPSERLPQATSGTGLASAGGSPVTPVTTQVNGQTSTLASFTAEPSVSSSPVEVPQVSKLNEYGPVTIVSQDNTRLNGLPQSVRVKEILQENHVVGYENVFPENVFKKYLQSHPEVGKFLGEKHFTIGGHPFVGTSAPGTVAGSGPGGPPEGSGEIAANMAPGQETRSIFASAAVPMDATIKSARLWK